MLQIWYLFCCSIQESPMMTIERTFSPTIIGAVDRLEWRYRKDCMGVYAQWYTNLPKGTSVQLVAGPKIDGNHFDEDALQDVQTHIDEKGRATLSVLSSKSFPSIPSFINMRVWAKNKDLQDRIRTSQSKGGFPLAQGPDGFYAWIESQVPACTQ